MYVRIEYWNISRKIADWRCQGDKRGNFVLLSLPNLPPQELRTQKRPLIYHVNRAENVDCIVTTLKVTHHYHSNNNLAPMSATATATETVPPLPPTTSATTSASALTDDGRLQKLWWHRYGRIDPIPSITHVISTIGIKIVFSFVNSTLPGGDSLQWRCRIWRRYLKGEGVIISNQGIMF